MPSKFTRAPVGSTPHSDPRCVPTAVQCTAERSPSVTVERTSSAKSGKAAKNSVKYSRTPPGPTASTCPAMCSSPSGAHSAAIASTSRRASAAK